MEGMGNRTQNLCTQLLHDAIHAAINQVTMQMVRDILMYMDRTYVSFNKKMPVYEMGLVVFRDTVARHDKVKGRLQSLLLQVCLL